MGTKMKVRKAVEIDIPDLEQAIKRAREADPRPLVRIAADAGMTAANWYKIESGETKVLPLETLRKIEEVLGVDFGVQFDD